MRLKITHETVYRYDEPAAYAIQTVRLTPRDNGNQFVVDWRVEVSQDCRLRPVEDPFGNITHSFSVDGPFEELSIVATGEVLVEEANGVVRGVPDRMPTRLYLRDTGLTRPDAAIHAFARDLWCGQGGERLATLHVLSREINRRLRFDPAATDTQTTAAQAFGAGHGVCQDFAHVFVAAARSIEVPARYVSGYMWRLDGENEQPAAHAWAEAWIDDQLGWVGFDPANDVCPTEAYVRVASGLDYLDALPIRGVRHGGSGETMTVRVTVEDIAAVGRRRGKMPVPTIFQAQSQSQSPSSQSQSQSQTQG